MPSTTVNVHIPRDLRAYCGGVSPLPLAADTVRAALHALERLHPSVYRGICDETGSVRRHINIFVNNDHIRDRGDLDTPLAPHDTLLIVPAVSGG